MDKKALEALAREKLESSGLDWDKRKAYGIELLSGKQVVALHPSLKPLGALRLAYHGPDGEPCSDVPGGEPYFRLRYLEQPVGFDALTIKPPRYVQLPNTLPVAYLPRVQDWGILDDVGAPLILTEGELKALKACAEGFPTVALGGVYSWRSLPKGVEFLPSLEQIAWCRRNVYVVFDSDYRTNPAICSAIHGLAAQLHRRGAFVHLVSLPALPDREKTGLDDYLTFGGPSAAEGLRDLLRLAEPLGLTRPLWALNKRYHYVRDPGLVVDVDSFMRVSPAAFTQHLASPLQYEERSIKKDGTVSFKPVSAAAAWLRWPLRSEVSTLTYAPGAERLAGGAFNVWPGWGCAPAEGSTAPFDELVAHLFGTAEPTAREWFLNWCAYPLQHPGAKLFTSVVLHGVLHGTGKSLLAYTLGKIYGKNFTEISRDHLHSGFNEWAQSKQLILGDDVASSNRRDDADMLKKLITQKELRVNVKYLPSYTVPDCVNYFFTSNHPDAFFLEDNDRRFFVHEIEVEPLSEEFFTGYDRWLYEENGAAAVFYMLLRRDVSSWNSRAPALRTAAKERMISDIQSDLGAWVRQLLLTPDHLLKFGDISLPQDVFTSAELLLCYDPGAKTGTTANGLGRELRRAGVHQVCRGQPVRRRDGSQARYYAVRNRGLWMTAAFADVAQHLDEKAPLQKAKKNKY